MNIVQAFARQALAHPQAIAFRVPQGIVTYGTAIANVAHLAAGMARLGVRRGDIVAIAAREIMPHAWLTLAVGWLGAVSVSVGSGSTPDEKTELATRCKCTFYFHGDNEIALDIPGQTATRSLRDLLAMPRESAVPIEQMEPRDLWRIGFSSGTTGRPKAILFTQEAGVLRNTLQAGLVPMKATDRVLVDLGPGLVFALTYWLRALSVGATVVSRQANPAETWKAARHHAITYLVTSPGNGLQLMAAAQATGESGRPAHIGTLVLGGAPVTVAQRRQFRERICDNLVISYGATEIGAVGCLDAALMDADVSTAGRIPEWIDIQAVDEEGRPLPHGKRGLLRVRSATMASGYLLPADANPDDARAFRDGWFYSKDIGHTTREGLVYLTGRASDVINLDGNKIDPADVEKVLGAEPEVLDCVVVAARKGAAAVLVAVIVPQARFEWAELQRRCAAKLPMAQVPTTYLLTESLPRNAAGKIMRDEVARSLAGKAFTRAQDAPAGSAA